MPSSASPISLLAGVVFFSLGDGLLDPSLGGLISRTADARTQGFVQGGAQAVQSLAFVLGPLWGSVLYTRLGHAAPYWSSVAVIGFAIGATILALPSVHAGPAPSDEI